MSQANPSTKSIERQQHHPTRHQSQAIKLMQDADRSHKLPANVGDAKVSALAVTGWPFLGVRLGLLGGGSHTVVWLIDKILHQLGWCYSEQIFWGIVYDSKTLKKKRVRLLSCIYYQIYNTNIIWVYRIVLQTNISFAKACQGQKHDALGEWLFHSLSFL